MKKGLLVIAVLLSAMGSFAQPFQFQKSGNLNIWGMATDSDIEGDDFLNNSSSATISNMRWEATNVTIPAGWQFYVCDPGACQTPGTQNANFPLPTGNSLFSFHFMPNNIAGSGSMTVVVFDNNNPSVSITKTINVKAAGLSAHDVSKSFINIYPNPASDWISVSLSKDIQEATIEMYNLLGRKVKSDKMVGSNDHHVMNIEDLAKGNYIIRVTPKGQNPITKSIQKY